MFDICKTKAGHFQYVIIHQYFLMHNLRRTFIFPETSFTHIFQLYPSMHSPKLQYPNQDSLTILGGLPLHSPLSPATLEWGRHNLFTWQRQPFNFSWPVLGPQSPFVSLLGDSFENMLSVDNNEQCNYMCPYIYIYNIIFIIFIYNNIYNIIYIIYIYIYMYTYVCMWCISNWVCIYIYIWYDMQW